VGILGDVFSFDLMAEPEAKFRRSYEAFTVCEVRTDLMVHGGRVISSEQRMCLVRYVFGYVPVAQQINTPIHYVVRLYCTVIRK
jgi:hypothetical protein